MKIQVTRKSGPLRPHKVFMLIRVNIGLDLVMFARLQF